MSDSLDRLEELKDSNKHPSEGDVERYRQLEKDIRKAEQYKDFLSHPITREIVERISAWIVDANAKLIAGKGDSETVVRRDDLLDLLRIFSPLKADTNHLTQDIPNEIKALRDYYKGFPGT